MIYIVAPGVTKAGSPGKERSISLTYPRDASSRFRAPYGDLTGPNCLCHNDAEIPQRPFDCCLRVDADLSSALHRGHHCTREAWVAPVPSR
jgi:hypothetical protein